MTQQLPAGASLPSGTPTKCAHCGKEEDQHITERRYCHSIFTMFGLPLGDSRLRFAASPPSPTTPALRCEDDDQRCGAIQNHLTCTLPAGHAGDYHEDFDHGREWSVARPAVPQAWGCFACAFETDNDQMAWDHRKSPHRMYKLAAAPLGGEPDKAWRDGLRASAEHLAELIFNATYSPPQSPERRAAQQLVNAARSLLAHQLSSNESGLLALLASPPAGAPPCTFCGDGICARCAAEPRGAPETAPLLDLVEEWHDDLRDILDDPSTLNPGLMAEGTRIAHGMMLGRIANAMRDALESLAARPAEVPGGEPSDALKLKAHIMGCDECSAGNYCDEGEMYGGVVTHDYLTRITESNGCRADAVRARIAAYRAPLAPTTEVKDA